MINTSRTFRIFVSSTFDDMKAERNALQEKYSPNFENYVAKMVAVSRQSTSDGVLLKRHRKTIAQWIFASVN